MIQLNWGKIEVMQTQAFPNFHNSKSSELSLYYGFYNSPIGKITLIAHDAALVGLYFNGQKLAPTFQNRISVFQENPILVQTKSWLDSYFSHKKPNPCNIPLDPNGTNFQLATWRILYKIPYGEVTTYGAIAQQVAQTLGRPKMSAQAVGGAIGHNPISIIVPCHRVISATGNLTGYAGGLSKKKFLLDLENADLKEKAGRLHAPPHIA